MPVTLTQWIVNRNGDNTAPATSTAGCTIADLADEIGLDVDEFKKWLTKDTEVITLLNGATKSFDNIVANDILAAGQKFKIPNTMFSAWFGDDAQNMRKKWEDCNDELESLGFNVMIHDNDVFGIAPKAKESEKRENMKEMIADSQYSDRSKASSFNMLSETSDDKMLQGFFIYGHGENRPGKGPNNFGTSISYESTANGQGNGLTVLGPPVRPITYGEVNTKLKYKLGAVIVFTCYGTGDSESLLSSSENRVYFAKNGLNQVDKFENDLRNLWPDHKQHTR